MNQHVRIALDNGCEERLARLADDARRELGILAFPAREWVVPKVENGRPMLDVLIVGAGQGGLALGHALRLRGVHNILLLDRNPEGFEGVWETFARNEEMRSPKETMGIDLGFPSLTIQRYIEERYGKAEWAATKRVRRCDWMDYLRWYRRIADLPIRNETSVVDIAFDADGVTAVLESGESLRARYLVLATGMDAVGAWQVAPVIADNVPPGRYNHTSDILPDHSRFAGRRIGVLGAGASAFDISVTMLDAGAATVDMFMRRKQIPTIDAARELETTGLLDHTHELPDQVKWDLSGFMGRLSQAPAEHHFQKAMRFPNFSMHLDSPWESVTMDGDDIVVATPHGRFAFDHVFAATGVTIDMARRPELRRILPATALWKHRFTPSDDPTSPKLNYPYLDRCYRFTEREPGTAPGLDRIYAFCALSYLSMGSNSAAGIGSHKFGVPRIASGLTGALMREQADRIVPTLAAFKKPGLVLTPAIQKKLGMAVAV